MTPPQPPPPFTPPPSTPSPSHSKHLPHLCPHCDSIRIAKVIYGLPVLTEKLQRDLAAEKIVLGGSPNRSDNPTWICLNCQPNNPSIKTRPLRQKRSDITNN